MGMVCPWLDNGNLNSYLDKHGATLALCDRFRIVSGCRVFCRLNANQIISSFATWLLDCHIVRSTPMNNGAITEIDAVHSLDVVHGDLTGVCT